MQKREREILAQIERQGLEHHGITSTGGQHYAITVIASNGQRKKFYFSRTPSDHRADLNNLALIRRWLRGTETPKAA